MNKTVLMITAADSFVGVGHCNAAVLAALRQAGIRAVCVQGYEDTPLQARLLDLGVEFHWLDYDPNSDPWRFANDQEGLRKLIAEIRPDLVYFSNTHPQYSFAGIEAASSLSVPYMIREGIIAAHLLPKLEPRYATMRRHYQDADAVIGVCNQNLDLLRSHFRLPKEIGTMIPSSAHGAFFEPLDAERRRRLRENWGVPADAIVCFTTAKLEAVKGYEIQLAAIEKLMQLPEWEHLYFVWAGQGKLEAEISRRLGAMGAADHVTLAGYVWNVAELLDGADIFVLPSLAEGMPRAILEAMAKALPVIASDVGGNSEALGDCGIILPTLKDIETAASGLAGAISSWSRNEEARKTAAATGHQRARALYEEDAVMGQHVAVIENILRK